jgi:putative ABC transport system permease protein
LVLNVEAGGEVGLGNIWAVTGNFLTTLGQAPVVGRVLEPSDMSLTAGVGSDAVVIGYGFWQRRFAGAPDVLGSTVRIEGRALTVVGVAPEWFSGMTLGVAPDVIIPLTALPEINRALGQRRI